MRPMTSLRLVPALAIALLLLSCQRAAVVPDAFTEPTSSSSSSMQTIILGSSNGTALQLTVELADDPAEWEYGLMERTELPEGSGMLFVFGGEQPLEFWMKNTLVPLDVLFFDAAGLFLSSQTMEPCTADPCPLYPSSKPAKYALEVPAGFVEKYKVEAGWQLILK